MRAHQRTKRRPGRTGKIGHDGKGGQVQNSVEIAIFATM